jgi:thymidylate synthase (FAD)
MEVKLLRVTEEGIDLVAEAAKVSGVFSTQSSKEIVELIVDNDYSSVLEHIYFTFDISRISVALSRELLEHRIASHTARSTRYMEERGFGYYVPKELERKGKEEEARIYREAMKSAKDAYTKLREFGIAREHARYVLPLALHTHYVVTMNVRSLINFFMLRLCVRAAPEIRELAMRMYKICLEEYPDIFSKIWCRGFTLGICPENEVRPNECPFKKILPKKREIKGKFEERAKRIIEKELKTF